MVFDFDDTLVVSENLKLGAFERFAKAFGFSVSEVLFDNELKKRNRFDFVDEVLARASLDESESLNRSEIARQFSNELDRVVAGAPELKGATTLLGCLKTTEISVFLNSSTPQRNLEFQVFSRDWGQFFQGVYGGPDSKSRNLEAILSEWSCCPEQCLIVGDSDEDAEYASGAGAQFCRVPNTDADVFLLITEFLEIGSMEA